MFKDKALETLLLHNIIIKKCSQGEVYSNLSGVCLPCTIGTYSLDNKASQCTACPSQALNCYENNIILKPNFWKSEKTQIIYECSPFPESCLYIKNK